MARGGNLPTVLIVDDEPIVVEVFRAIFDGRFNVVRARTEAEVFDAIAHASIELVFLDINIAGTCGLEILRRIKHDDARIPVVMVSGLDNEGSIAESKRLGACEYILKPFDIEEVIAVADRAIGKKGTGGQGRVEV
jgi:DNA-binding NtrC family response regulator